MNGLLIVLGIYASCTLIAVICFITQDILDSKLFCQKYELKWFDLFMYTLYSMFWPILLGVCICNLLEKITIKLDVKAFFKKPILTIDFSENYDNDPSEWMR